MLIFKGIIIAVLAFCLGIALTLFCLRLKDGKKDNDVLLPGRVPGRCMKSFRARTASTKASKLIAKG